jgi:hypothetical protein
MLKQADLLKQHMSVARKDFKPQGKFLPKAPPDQRRILGLGAPPINAERLKMAANPREGIGAIIDAIKDSVDCPVWNMDVIEQVRWNLQGPIDDQAVTASFGAEIDLFGSGRQVDGVDYVETTMAQTGQTQTYMVACYIGFHLEPEPLCWTAQGNAWSHPVVGVATGAVPISPDVFTQNDRFNGALGAAMSGATPTQVFVPAVLEWGWWANYVAWMMARAYNLRWKIGQHTNIMDEVLRHTAYMPPSAQEGSASSSEVDIVDFVRRLNDRYDSLGTALNFLKINRLRIGSVLGTAATNLGIFKPDRSHELVGATYGGMDLRSMLRGNSEFRKLVLPYVIKPGVPIGLILQENDQVQGDIMRRYLSVTERFGTTPPLITDQVNIPAEEDGTNATPVGLERTVDGFNVAQQMDTDRALFKGGELKISLMVKGFEVTENWYDVLKSNPDLMAAVTDACGIRFAMQGAAA